VNGTVYRFTRELRHGGWRVVVLTAVLLGLGGGVALGATAGHAGRRRRSNVSNPRRSRRTCSSILRSRTCSRC
jgi:hypothetical protein